MSEHVFAFCGLEAIDREGHGVPQFWNGSSRDLSQEGFQLCEGHFYWVEIGGIGRKITQARPGCLDDLADTGHLMSRQIIHHDDVAGLKRRHEDTP